ncbi:MAG: hypothetical protein KJ970_02005 [Candidatus Eisenbacteria bacterium]|uniref:T9SS type A sorting domain-containing protein n=1 Tax=Eiseniibacteriota bacterium TaxID=2212470 RepID=A0A948RRS4_UNCEI|nr:hypothetical protein [Candidatus Eisenbacteria bacterium]
MRFYSGNLMVLDRMSDPYHIHSDPGAAFTINPDVANTVILISSPSDFVDPTDLFVAHQKFLYVTDAEADPRGFGDNNGAVFRIDPYHYPSQDAELMAASPRFSEPISILVDSENRLIVLDRRADPLGTGSPIGAVFRIDPVTQYEEILASSPEFRDLVRIIEDFDGSYLILDRLADPLGVGGGPGAIFRLDPSTFEMTCLFSQAGFTNLTSLRRTPDDDYILLDRDSDPFRIGGAPGAVYLVDRSTLTIADTLASHQFFRDPVDVAMLRDGRLFVLDRTADPLQLEDGQGAVFEMDPETNQVLGTWSRDGFVLCRTLVPVYGADLDSSTITVGDLNGPPLGRGDPMEVRLKLRNTGDEDTGRLTVVDSFKTGITLLPGSEVAASGEFKYLQDLPGLSWTSSLAPGAQELITFRIRVEEYARTPVEQYIRGLSNQTDFKMEWRVGLPAALDAWTVVVSDPTGIYSLDTSIGGLVSLTESQQLVAPAGLVFRSDGYLIIADSKADIVAGEAGAIFVMDPGWGEVSPLAAGLPVRTPAAVALGAGDQIYVADVGVPRPFPFPDEPGGVYKLSRSTYQPESLRVGEPFLHPIDLLLDQYGRLMVADVAADPLGLGGDPGAVFELDPTTGEVLRTFTHPDFVDPRGLIPLKDGRLLVVDRSADPLGIGSPTGALFEIDRSDGSVRLFFADSRLVGPTSGVQDTLGDILLADIDADPNNMGGNRGAIWRYNIAGNILTTQLESWRLNDPTCLTIFGQGDFRESWFEGADIDGPPLLPGDTVRVHAIVKNTGVVDAKTINAEFSGLPGIEIVSVSADSGHIGIMAGSNGALWLGSVRRDESLDLIANFVMDPQGEVSFWEPYNVNFKIGGGLFDGLPPLTFRLVTPLRQGDLIAVDRDSDPLGLGNRPGALLLMDEDGVGSRALFSDRALSDPVSAALDGEGNIVILDASANPAGLDHATGAIFYLDLFTGMLDLLYWSDNLYSPVELKADGGEFLIVDELADPFQDPVPERKGAIFRLESLQGPMHLFSAAEPFRKPQSLVRAGNGDIYVADISADPQGTGRNTGAVFRLDGETGALVETIVSDYFVDPKDLDLLPDGRILLTDEFSDPYGYPARTGALFTIDPATSNVQVYAHSPYFTMPGRSQVREDGMVMVADRGADPIGQDLVGAILTVDPDTRAVNYLAYTNQFRALRNFLYIPRPIAVLRNLASVDVNGGMLDPGDLITYHAVVANTGQTIEPEAAYVDTLPSILTLQEGSFQADNGTFEVIGSDQGAVFRWEGVIAAGDSAEISYQAILDPVTPPGTRIERVAEVYGSSGRWGGAKKLVHVVRMNLIPGAVYVVDSDIDPLNTGIPVGGVFRIGMPSGNLQLVTSGSELYTPIDAEVLSLEDETLVLLDSDADPMGYGNHRGALYKVEIGDGSLHFLAAEPTFLDPAQMVVVNENLIFVVDPLANPYAFPSRHGAIYRVDLPSGDVEVAYSDSALSIPIGIDLDDNGGLYIADMNADPFELGNRPGAIFRLDLYTNDLQVIASDTLFVDPYRVLVHPAGDLFVLDRGAMFNPETGAVGAVFRIHDGTVSFHSQSKHFRRPVDLFMDKNNSLLVVDSDADPLVLGGHPGAVFRYNPTTDDYVIVSANPYFIKPMAAFVHLALTPVFLRYARAEVTSDGKVLLMWEVESDIQPSGYLIQRRIAGSEDIYETLNPQQPVVGWGALLFEDDSAEAGRDYEYLIAALLPDGGVHHLGPVHISVPGNPIRLVLDSPKPNPFGSRTILRFGVPRREEISLVIYDVNGRMIRRLADGRHDPGFYNVEWDGRNEIRNPVASGVYFARLSDPQRRQIRRLILLR